jgi:oligosaccharyltransferase complex subunit delta (ribophorin II)
MLTKASRLTPNTPLSKPVALDSTSTLKIVLTTTENKTPKKPHQAHLLLRDPISNLDISYPLSVKDTGKSKVEITFKDLPVQFIRTNSPLTANLVIGSFGSSTGYNAAAFTLAPSAESAAVPVTEKPLRYGKLPEIHHIFKADAKSPPKVISLFFALAILPTVPILLGAVSTYLFQLSEISSDID